MEVGNPKNDTGGGLDTKGCVKGKGEKARIYAAYPILAHNTYVVVNTSHDIWLAAASQRAAGRRRRSSRHSASCPCRYAAMGSIALRMFPKLVGGYETNKPYWLMYHTLLLSVAI